MLQDDSSWQSHHYWITSNLSELTKAERKLLLIPLIFIFLRIWDIVDVFWFVYLNKGKNDYWLQLLTVSSYGNDGHCVVNILIMSVLDS